MANKKLLNDPDSCVKEMLEGVAASFPALCVNPETRIVMLNRDRHHRVGLLCGGGSGHEPFAAGYVGECMLTGVVAGNVFTSPPTSNILTAITNISRLNKGGVFVIILNYTGDVLNFGLAMETARSKGIAVESIVIGDDVSLTGRDSYSMAGKRGICGALFVFKIAGALSTAGRVLSEIALEARAVTCRLATVGVALSPCSTPGGPPLFHLADDEIGFGVGIHGEAGVAVLKMATAHEIVKVMLQKIISNLVIQPGNDVCAMINNLGATTQMEMFVIAREVKHQLTELGYKVQRIYVGTLVTSLNMSGVQVSVLNVTGREEWLAYLDYDTEAFAWPGARISRVIEKYPDLPISFETENKVTEMQGMELNDKEGNIFRNCIKAACESLISKEARLNELDSGAGDGDCGTTLRHFATATVKALPTLPVKRVGTCFSVLSQIAETEMGGTSGALYSLMFLGAAKNATDWTNAWHFSLEMVKKYTSARLGHRTMLDALIPACETYEAHIKELGESQWLNALKLALDKADEGCNKTASMVAKAGRASYVNPSIVNEVDAGAFAVTVWLRAIYLELFKYAPDPE